MDIGLYFFIALAWAMLYFSFKMRDFPIAAITGFILMAIGVYGLSTAFGFIGGENILTMAISLAHLGIGFYIIIRGSWEIHKKPKKESLLETIKKIKTNRRLKNDKEKRERRN